jgi:hypothetical protein
MTLRRGQVKPQRGKRRDFRAFYLAYPKTLPILNRFEPERGSLAGLAISRMPKREQPSRDEFSGSEWFDQTSAVTPLSSQSHPGAEQTFPFGL